jgi:hypothetical protein
VYLISLLLNRFAVYLISLPLNRFAVYLISLPLNHFAVYLISLPLNYSVVYLLTLQSAESGWPGFTLAPEGIHVVCIYLPSSGSRQIFLPEGFF